MPLPGSREVWVGIDPGASGGMALLGREGVLALPQPMPMPKTLRDVWEIVTGWTHNPVNIFAAIEKVSGYIGQGQPGSAMFKFGASYGALCMALTAAGIPFEEIPPQRWQKGLGIPGRKRDERKGAWKNRLKAHAQKLFPDVQVTLATADALLIAEYARRMRLGLLK